MKVGERVFYDSDSGCNIPTRHRRVGFMFQQYALFPHLTVRGNVAFGLKRPLRRLDNASAKRVDEFLEAFGLRPMAGYRPSELSGGQRQRVALARCLVTNPRPAAAWTSPSRPWTSPCGVRMRP